MAEPAVRAILAFLGLVLACGVLIAATAALTRERIEENRARRFLATLTELTGSAESAARVRWSGDVAPLCDGRALLRGTARGYGGEIRWLAAAELAGDAPILTGLRITAHQETPGIADFLDRPGQGWLAALEGAAEDELADVDVVSGATITSRALRRALSAALAQPGLAERECEP
jgi:Na+-translocating ferredoxin:NAD+ oxidoreductase RnfG subunit